MQHDSKDSDLAKTRYFPFSVSGRVIEVRIPGRAPPGVGPFREQAFRSLVRSSFETTMCLAQCGVRRRSKQLQLRAVIDLPQQQEGNHSHDVVVMIHQPLSFWLKI